MKRKVCIIQYIQYIMLKSFDHIIMENIDLEKNRATTNDHQRGSKIKIKNIVFAQKMQHDVDDQLKNFHKRLNKSFSNVAIPFYQLENLSLIRSQKKTESSKKRPKLSEVFKIQSVNITNKPNCSKNKMTVSDCKVQRKIRSSKDKETAEERPTIPFLKQRKFQLFIDQKDKYKTYFEPRLKKGSKFNEIQGAACSEQRAHDQAINGTRQIDFKKRKNTFQDRFEDYFQKINKICLSHGLEFRKNFAFSPKFYFLRGNNSKLVRQLIKKRWWWTIIQEKDKDKYSGKINFMWTQLKDKSFYSSPKLYYTNKEKVYIHNHFQSNEIIGNKKSLYYVMKAYYEEKKQNVFDHLPLTFHIDRADGKKFNQFSEFAAKDFSETQKKRLWILKPGQNTNRGKGITLHSQIHQIKSQIQKQLQSLPKPAYDRTFIIQSYIQKPFLYNRRKFDIRCYMLMTSLNGHIKGYWYDKGYIRTSCYQFKTDDIENAYIHLTNDAVQKNCEEYGKFQDGNKLDYTTFKRYLSCKYGEKYDFDKQIYSILKKTAKDCMHASYSHLSKSKNHTVFELFGLDFMIDSNFKPWLIEVNTNPCLETSCHVLERIIPRLVDDVFKLVIDPVFPPPQEWPDSKKHLVSTGVNGFQLIFDEKEGNAQ